MRTVLKVTKSIIERKKRGRRHDKKRATGCNTRTDDHLLTGCKRLTIICGREIHNL